MSGGYWGEFLGTDQIVGERGELFDPANHHVVDALVLTLLDEGMIDLTCRIE